MAKMFYTLEEAAGRLGRSADAVKEMVAKGQLQEFRDRDRLMFKVEQVDLLAEDNIPLADSGSLDAIGLAGSSGTAMPMDKDSGQKESTGIALFDPDATEEADANAVTRITSSPAGAFSDPGSSGSGSRAGLLDLSKEADDTSLGGGLLDDIYGSETVAQQTAVEAPGGLGADAGGLGGGDAGGLFETPAGAAGLEPAVAGAGGMMMMAAEPFDGPGSGLAGGLALGMIVVLALAVFTTVMGLTGAAGTGLLSTLGDNFYAIAGGAAGLVLISGILGWVMGRR